MKDLANIVSEVRNELINVELAPGVSIDKVKRALCANGFRLVPINRESDAPKCAPQWRIEKLF